MRALVLSGGSAKIAFQLGVFDAMPDSKKEFDAFFGVSCGAIFAAMLAQNKLEQAYRLILNLTNSDIYKGEVSVWQAVKRIVVGKKSVLDISPLRKLLIENVRKVDFVKPAYFTYVDLCSGLAVTVCTDNLKTSEEIIDAIMASAMMPLAMPPVEKNGKMLVDGGIRKVCPIGEAVKLNPDEIVVINCFSRQDKATIPMPKNIFQIASRTFFDLMVDEIAKQSINTFIMLNQLVQLSPSKQAWLKINGEERIVKAFRFSLYEPEADLGDSFDFNRSMMLKRYQHGYNTLPKFD